MVFLDFKLLLMCTICLLTSYANSQDLWTPISVGGETADLTISSTSLNFEEATAKCKSQGGSIATINNDISLDALVAHINSFKELRWEEKIWTRTTCGFNSSVDMNATLLTIRVSNRGGNDENLTYIRNVSSANLTDEHKYACKRDQPNYCGEKYCDAEGEEKVELDRFNYTLCMCKRGYVRRNGSCQVVCPAAAIGGFNFRATATDGGIVQSEEQCDKGPSNNMSASIRCLPGTGKNGIPYFFDVETLVSVSCNKTLNDVLDEFENITNSEDYANVIKETEVLVSRSGNLSSGDIEKVSSLLLNYSKEAKNDSNINVEDTFSRIVNIASRLSIDNAQNTAKAQDDKAQDDKAQDDKAQSIEQNIETNPGSKIVTAVENLIQRVEYKGEDKTFPSDHIHVQVTGTPNEETTKDILYHIRPASTTFHVEPFMVTLPASTINKVLQNTENRDNRNSSYLKISFIAYNNDGLFPSTENVSSILGVKIDTNIPLVDLETPIKIVFENETRDYGQQIKTRTNDNIASLVDFQQKNCVFWSSATMTWADEGSYVSLAEERPVCRYYHATNFALLVSIHKVPADIILNVFSDVGCIITIIALSATVILYLLNKKLRSHVATKIQIHIFSNLIVAYVVFLVGLDKALHSLVPCTIVAVLIHYTFLVSFIWMALYSWKLYKSLIKVFPGSSENYMMKAGAVAYGIPALIIALSVSITFGHFDKSIKNPFYEDTIDSPVAGRKKSFYLADNMCWLNWNVLLYSFLIIVCLIMANNLIVLIIIAKNVIFKKSEIRSTAEKRSKTKQVFMVVTMSVTLGLSWIAGIFLLITPDYYYQKIFSWIFVLVTSLQGILVFYLICIRRREMFKFWFDPLKSIFSSKDEASKFSNLELSNERKTSQDHSRSNTVI